MSALQVVVVLLAVVGGTVVLCAACAVVVVGLDISLPKRWRFTKGSNRGKWNACHIGNPPADAAKPEPPPAPPEIPTGLEAMVCKPKKPAKKASVKPAKKKPGKGAK